MRVVDYVPTYGSKPNDLETVTRCKSHRFSSAHSLDELTLGPCRLPLAVQGYLCTAFTKTARLLLVSHVCCGTSPSFCPPDLRRVHVHISAASSPFSCACAPTHMPSVGVLPISLAGKAPGYGWDASPLLFWPANAALEWWLILIVSSHSAGHEGDAHHGCCRYVSFPACFACSQLTHVVTPQCARASNGAIFKPLSSFDNAMAHSAYRITGARRV